MTKHVTGTREHWLAARLELLGAPDPEGDGRPMRARAAEIQHLDGRFSA